MSVLAGQLGPLGVTTRREAAAGWTPEGMANLTGWWDASTLEGYSNGQTVTAWPDLSSEGNDLTAVVAPTYVESSTGGLPAVYSTGGDAGRDYFLGSKAGLFNTIYAVAEYANATFLDYDALFGATDQLMWLGNLGSENFYTPSGVEYWADGTLDAVRVGPMLTPKVMMWRKGSSSVSTTPQIGRDRTQARRMWFGTHSEVLAFNAVHSTDDRQLVEGYLAHKYGLAGNLPGDHPYKSSAPEAP